MGKILAFFSPSAGSWFFGAHLLIVLLLVLDQGSKWYVINFSPKGETIVSWLSWQLHYNDGAAFSLPIPLLFIILLTFLIIIALYWYLFRFVTCALDRAGLSLLIAGAVGNLLDRVIFGQVTDFIVLGWWPVFNLADSFITIGIALIIFSSVLATKK